MSQKKRHPGAFIKKTTIAVDMKKLSTIGRGMIVSHIKKLIKKNNDMVHQK
jgi:hypothetical protein